MAGRTLHSYLGYLLSDAEHRVNQQFAEQLRRRGVPVEYWRILQALADGRGHSMGELADAVLLNHPTLTKIINRMVAESLVYRRQSADDRRRVVVHSAARGRTLLQRLDAAAAAHQKLVTDAFGADETALLMRQLQDLLRCLAPDEGSRT